MRGTLLLLLLGGGFVTHLAILLAVAVDLGSTAEVERAYASAPSCDCLSKPEQWCPTENIGHASCRWAVRTRVLATPISGGSKGRYTHWVMLEVRRGLAAEQRVEVARFNAIVGRDVQQAARLGKEVHAEIWRDRVTALRVDGVVTKLPPPSTNSLVAFGAYAVLATAFFGGLLGLTAWRQFRRRPVNASEQPPA